ncbi:MAG: nucleotidyl transferase AbiEii/AbiGii toxin family protein [Candidatus Omnitrophica bacterium]|nr:nucleotidyl transferase AbiEii/AbiGii toxin family protein [Candidatus Omnitrophota bacterium]
MAFPRLLTKNHRLLLKTIAGSPLQKHVFFTGGTALASVYLGHRHSEDLDLFSLRPIDAGLLLPWQRRITRQGFRVQREVIGARHRYFVIPPRARTPVRLDFVEFPFESIEPLRLAPELGLRVDTLLDIAVNKVHALTDRTEAKDFVDLYVLFQHQPAWRWETLINWVRLKFDLHIDRLSFAHRLAQVETLRGWPRLTRPLPHATLRQFFLDAAQRLGREAW